MIKCSLKQQLRVTTNAVILSEQSESKDLGTDFTANMIPMRRFLDFANAPLGMTYRYIVRFDGFADESR